MTQERATGEKKVNVRQPERSNKPAKRHDRGAGPEASGMISLQQTVGNQAVQRLIALRSDSGQAQRSGGEEGFDLDEETSSRINQARGSGQSLDSAVQTQMSEAMGHDFSGVRVHTSPEADALNQQLSAKAFTTGQDVFFKQGEYNPGSSSGRELIAHELTHVVQQGSGQVGGSGSGMSVRPAGDAFEQEADAIAHQVATTGHESGSEAAGAGVQRQMPEEEEVQARAIQRQMPEEEEVQAKAIQRQEVPEEEV